MNPRTALSDQESRMSWLTMHITNHIYYLTGSSTYNSLSYAHWCWHPDGLSITASTWPVLQAGVSWLGLGLG